MIFSYVWPAGTTLNLFAKNYPTLVREPLGTANGCLVASNTAYSHLALHTPSIVSIPPTMKISIRLMAMPTAAGSTQGLKPAPLALLPPLPLYRRLLRTHRKFLSKEQRLLGDDYVKHEFRRHQNVENPVHIVRILPLLVTFTDSF